MPDTFYEGSVTGVSESGGVICVVGVQQFEGQTRLLVLGKIGVP